MLCVTNGAYISIHAPHEGERHTDTDEDGYVIKISIHAPHEGERPCIKRYFIINKTHFNPRSPRGGATRQHRQKELCIPFQSTLPTRGSDMLQKILLQKSEIFQSTLPTRGSDADRERQQARQYISIHAPHEGERQLHMAFIMVYILFQSTLPTRGSDARGGNL